MLLALVYKYAFISIHNYLIGLKDKDFFLQTLQFTSEEFKYLMSMSRYCSIKYTLNVINSWAIDGNKEVTKETEVIEPVTKKQKEDVEKESQVTVKEISPALRKEYGYKAKRLIDVGRINYLEKQGYDAKLLYFVENSVTPENCLLLATPKNKSI